MSTRCFSAMASPSYGYCLRLLDVEPVQLFQDAVHLGQHFLTLLAQARQLGPVPLRGPQLGLESHHLGLQRITLLAQAGDGLGGAPYRLLELLETLREPFRHPLLRHAPRTSARNRPATSATISSCTPFTSASVRVRAGAWNVRLQARLRRPPPTWPPVYTSNRVKRVSRGTFIARIAASTCPAVTSALTTIARSRWTAGKRGSGSYLTPAGGCAASAVTDSSAAKTAPGRSKASRAASATSPNQPSSVAPRTSPPARPGSRYAGAWS